jgi:uncharacterized repeat protein (TIGR01451 family)
MRQGGFSPTMKRCAVWLVTAFTLACVAESAEAQIVRNFTTRYTTNDRGNYVFVGNTVMTCPDAASGCANARIQAGSLTNNQDFTMVNVDVDAVETGANSSSATLTLPSGSTVKYAALYWGAVSSSAARNLAKLRTPASATYSTITAGQLDVSGTAYHAFADVTSLIAAGGSGVYTVADVKATTGANAYGGWGLVVVYADATELPHNVTLFDGFASIQSGGGAANATVSGFVTPPAGTVNAKVGLLAYEGDFSNPGDSFRVNGIALTNALNPANNIFNSTISNLGTHVTAKTPHYLNQLGFDIDSVDATGNIANSATSAALQFAPGSDNYLPGVLVFSIDVFQPLLAPNFVKTVTDVNGGLVTPGDVLEYVVSVSNTGNDSANAVILRDAIPASTTYVPGSLSVLTGANSGVKTDGSGDDQAEYDSINNRVVFRLGTGATAAAGGTLAATASTSIRFRVTIGAATANGTSITNSAGITYTENQLGGAQSITSNTTTSTIAIPDLTIAKSHTGSFVRGSTGAYSLVVSNSGLGSTLNTVTVSDTLPAGLTPTTASGTGWSCGIASQTVTCTRSDALAASASYPAITIGVSVSQGAAASVTNTATVSGGSETNTGNNSSSDITAVVSSADLSITKTGPGSAIAGGTVVYTVTVTNNGPSNATGVSVADPTPAGLNFVSNTGACTTAYPCSIGALASGASAVITTTYSLPGNYSTPTTITNTATVSATTTDPTSSNDSATATTPVSPSTDLSISKSGPASVTSGNNVVYTVQVSNVGGLSAANVTVADPTPAGLTFVSNSGACTTAYPCSLGTLAASGTATITTTYTVPASYTTPSPIVNTASVSTTTTDHAPGNNSSTANTSVVQSADVSITKTGPASVTTGTSLVYTVVVTNNGTSDAAAVTVSDTTPSGLTFVSNTGNCTTAYPCSLGIVPAGATRTITSTYAVPSSYTTPNPIVNTASVSTTTTDPTPGNNSDGESTPVVASADMAITKSGPPTVLAGNNLVYTVVVTNNGTSDATSVSVADPTPPGLTFVSNTGDCTTAYPCALGTVAAGATRTITSTYAVPLAYGTPDPIVNTATVSSATTDPVAGNNSDSESTPLTPSTDLSITKTGPASVTAGTSLVYTIVVSNNGGSPALATTVADPTPSGLVFVSNTGDCTTAFPCSLGSVPAGETRTITTTYGVPSSYTAPDPILNTATVSTSTIDAIAGNDSDTESTPLVTSADLAITKTGPASVTAGTDLVYTVVVTNNGASDALAASVADSTPPGLSFVSNTGDCTTAYPCALGAVPAGESRTITTTYSVPAAYTSPDPILNTASVSSATADPVPGNDSDTESTPLVTSADVEITKTGPASVTAGQNVVYTVTVTNNGVSNAAAVSVADPTPSGLVFVSNTGDCTSAFPCAFGSLAPGATRTITSTFSVPSSYTTPDPIENTATVSTTTSDPSPANNTSTATTDVDVSADLEISKTGPASVTAGEVVVYTVTVTNNGQSDAAAVSIADPTPSGLVFISNTGDCTTAYPCSLGTVPAGATRTITSTFTVPASYTSPDPIVNTATVSTTTSDPVAANDSDTASTALVTSADLSITKTGPASVVSGTDLVYTIVVTNDGISDAQAVEVADPTPAGLTFLSNGGDCTTPFPCVLGTLAPGATRTITTTFAVPPSYMAPDPIVNTATVSSTTSDPDGADNSDTESTPVDQSADVAITKLGPNAALQGSNLIYTVTVTNNGDSDAANVSVADPTPPGLTFVSNTGACTTAYPCALGTLAPDEQRTITTTYFVPFTYTTPDPIVNTATVSTTTSDPVAGNDSSTSSTAITIVNADLSVVKSGPAAAVPGTNVVYTLLIANNGPDAASNTVVSDLTPPGLTFVSNTGDCTTAFPCSLGNLANGATRTITTTFSVPASYTTPDPIQNSAFVTSDAGDSDGTDNTSVVQTQVTPEADLSLDKTGPPTIVAGANLVYTIVVTNNGSSNAAGVSVGDPTPAGTTFVSNAGDCSTAFPCDLGFVETGGTRTITATFAVPSNFTPPGPIDNTATVSAATTDPVGGNDSDTVSTTVTASADLAIDKTAPASVTPGENLVYTITLTNNGLSDAENVSIADPTPAGLGFVSNTGDCTTAFPCALGTVPAGATRTITSTFSVPSGYLAPDPIVNTATASTTTSDPNGGNDSDSASTAVSPSADVSVVKTGPASATPGEDVVYTIVVTNSGSSDAAGVSVADATPAGLTFVSNAGDCTTAFPCALGIVPAGSTRTITSTFSVPASYTTPDPIENTATVSTTTSDPTPGNDSSTASTPVSASADLRLEKTGPASVVAGNQVVYTISVTNDGSSDAQAVSVADPTPAGLTFVSNAGDCTTAFPCALGTVADGATRTITSTYTVSAGYAVPGPIVNTATVSSSTTDPDGSDDSDSVSTTVTASADVSVTKSDATDPIELDADQVYTITVSNAGPSNATGVVVTDTIDAATTFVSSTGGCVNSMGTLTCNVGALAAGASTVFTVTVHVPDTAPTDDTLQAGPCNGSEDICNNVSVTAAQSDPDPSDNADSEPTDVEPLNVEGLRLAVTDSPDAVLAGSTLTYVLTYSNVGAQTIQNANLTVTYDGATTFVSATPAATMGSGFWALGSLTPGETGQITVTTSVSAVATDGSSLLLSAELNGTHAIPALADEPTRVRTNAPNHAALSVEKTVTPASTYSGGLLAYTITVTNDGPATAYGTVVSDSLPADVTYLNADPAPDTVAGNDIEWSVGDIASGESFAFVVYAGTSDALPDGTLIENVASAVGTTGAGTVASAGLEAEGSVVAWVTGAAADCGVVARLRSMGIAQPDGELVYRLLWNDACEDIPGAALTLDLPTGLTFVSLSSADVVSHTVENGGQRVVMQLGEVLRGRVGAAFVRAHVDAGVAPGTDITSTSSLDDAAGRSFGSTDTSTVRDQSAVLETRSFLRVTGPVRVIAGKTPVYIVRYRDLPPSSTMQITVIGGYTVTSFRPSPAALGTPNPDGSMTWTFSGLEDRGTIRMKGIAHFEGPDEGANVISIDATVLAGDGKPIVKSGRDAGVLGRNQVLTASTAHKGKAVLKTQHFARGGSTAAVRMRYRKIVGSPIATMNLPSFLVPTFFYPDVPDSDTADNAFRWNDLDEEKGVLKVKMIIAEDLHEQESLAVGATVTDEFGTIVIERAKGAP